jgi:2-polyprenyl-3-methyl-5-hydroxy-6-metoxy-1,4-benzoquinol methylase
MLRDDSYRIEIFENEEQEKVISEDLCEIYTVFKYISTGLSYHRNCLRNLKVLEIGCGSGENLNLALNHGASFVSGLDLSSSVIQAATSNFTKAGIDSNRFLFTKANLFSLQSCELSLPASSYENFFDRVLSCWIVSQARSLNDVRELISIARKYLKHNGDLVLLMVNPLMIANFPAVKQLPRIENFRLVDVVEEGDHFKMKSQILQPFTEEVLMEVTHNVFSIEQIKGVLEDMEFNVKHQGNLELTPRDEQLSYPFEMISQELSKDVTMGYFIHAKKPRLDLEKI